MSRRRSRDKGARTEGPLAPLRGSEDQRQLGSYRTIGVRDMIVGSYRTIGVRDMIVGSYRTIGVQDMIVRADRQEPLLVVWLSLAAKIAKRMAA